MKYTCTVTTRLKIFLKKKGNKRRPLLHFLLSKHNDNYGAKWLMSAVPCLNTHALHVHWPDLRHIYQSTKISIPGAGFKPGRHSAELTIPGGDMTRYICTQYYLCKLYLHVVQTVSGKYQHIHRGRLKTNKCVCVWGLFCPSV